MIAAGLRIPGIYNLPAAEYHADPCVEPSLSNSLAKQLIQTSPRHAWMRHPRLNPHYAREESETFDLGTAAHAVLLQGEAAVAIIDAKDWRTTAAKDARTAARLAKQIPILAARWADVQAMVIAARDQLAAHRDGRLMFLDGQAEQTFLWKDQGVWCRALLDYHRRQADALFPWAIDDYKTTGASANPDEWTRTLFSSGFDLQVAWYQRAVHLVTGEQAQFRFAVQENFPPYALSVIALGPDAAVIAEKKRQYAVERWQDCRARDVWPTYPDRTCYAALPGWMEAWWCEKETRE